VLLVVGPVNNSIELLRHLVKAEWCRDLIIVVELILTEDKDASTSQDVAFGVN
jgi:hypothetical protein